MVRPWSTPIVLVAMGCAAEASAIGLQIDVAGNPAAGTTTLEIGLAETTPITGYELFVGWDPQELHLSHGTPVWGGSFLVAPESGDWESSRVAQLSLMLIAADVLFHMTFATSPVLAFDGAADFYVQVARGGISGPPGTGLLDLGPAVGLDLGPSGWVVAPVPDLPEPQPAPAPDPGPVVAPPPAAPCPSPLEDGETDPGFGVRSRHGIERSALGTGYAVCWASDPMVDFPAVFLGSIDLSDPSVLNAGVVPEPAPLILGLAILVGLHRARRCR